MTNIPVQPTALVGRKTEFAAVADLVKSRRLVTLTGPGGIGKTQLAIEVARRLSPDFADGAWIVDLASLMSADAVAPTIAARSRLGLDNSATSPDLIAARVASRHLLLVLDHCEHVILAAARLAEGLLRANPAIHVLATSREPLLVDGEQPYSVPPLAVPPADAPHRKGTLRLGAVKLFFARLHAADPGIVPDARTAAIAGAICRRLGGIPLAIELAAFRAATKGVADVETQLDDHFKQLLGGRRTPLPRHKTLRATLDWSYGMLSAAERTTLLHIAIFSAPFDLDDARGVVSDAGADIRDSLHGLVASSFVAFETNGATVRYHLLEPIRAYGLEKLLQTGEYDRIARLQEDYLAGQAGPDARRELPHFALADGFRGLVKRQGDRRAFEATPVLCRMETP
jgi:predicted ATPase